MSPPDRRLAANRLNASKSTGPRSLAGKAKSRLNAIRHGLNVPISRHDTLIQAQELIAEISLTHDLDADDFLILEFAEAVVHFRRVTAAKVAALDVLDDFQVQGAQSHPIDQISYHLQRLMTLEGYERKAHSRMLRVLARLDAGLAERTQWRAELAAEAAPLMTTVSGVTRQTVGE